jgi:hypothetical protein
VSVASDMLELGRSVRNEVFGGTAGTYAQGAATKAATSEFTRLKLLRAGADGGLGIDEDESVWEAPLAFFTSGFAGGSSSSVTPTPGDTWTPTGEKAWTLASCRKPGEAHWSLTFRRRRQKAAL